MNDSTNEENQRNVPWGMDITHPELVSALDASLRQVMDPELGLNIIELGMIRNAEISDNHADITMILTTPFCPYGPALIQQAKERAEIALEMPTTVHLGMEMWDRTMMEEGAGADWGFF